MGSQLLAIWLFLRFTLSNKPYWKDQRDEAEQYVDNNIVQPFETGLNGKPMVVQPRAPLWGRLLIFIVCIGLMLWAIASM